MDLTINTKLDPVFETLGLLLISYNYNKEKMIKDLNELVEDGEAFYNQNLGVFDQYIQTFTSFRKSDTNDQYYFCEECDQLVLMLAVLFQANNKWLSSFDDIPEEQLRNELIRSYLEIFDDTIKLSQIETVNDIISFLDQSSMEENMKWKLLNLLQYPHKHISTLIQIINNNIPAFHKAEASVEKELSLLIKQYSASIPKQSDTTFLKLRKEFSNNSSIYPTLIFPIAHLILDSNCYYGLLVDSIVNPNKQQEYSQQSLLLKLKAISDKSKLQILCSLKISPKYNLEIAEQLGLTAATMSHHMNVLLGCEFVGVNKRDGKVYYHLETENIRQFIKDMEDVLL